MNKKLQKIIADGSQKAILKAQKLNIPFVVQEGRKIVKVFPNGEKVTVGHLERAYFCLSKKNYKMRNQSTTPPKTQRLQ